MPTTIDGDAVFVPVLTQVDNEERRLAPPISLEQEVWTYQDAVEHILDVFDVPRDARHSRTGTKGGYDHAAEWIAACKGGPETACNFDYAGRMIEMMLLGHVAYRTGEEIIYDASRGKVTSHESANVHLAKKYREGWSLVG